MSYGLTVRVLEEVLPLEHVLAATTIRRRVATLGRRVEALSVELHDVNAPRSSYAETFADREHQKLAMFELHFMSERETY
jgi:hypothetical protein